MNRNNMECGCFIFVQRNIRPLKIVNQFNMAKIGFVENLAHLSRNWTYVPVCRFPLALGRIVTKVTESLLL